MAKKNPSDIESQNETLNNDEIKVEKAKSKKDSAKHNDISPAVDKILKMYSGYSELYVSEKGGVYTVETPEHMRKDAVLYNNPYYKL